jgi:tubulin-like protein CetZ
MKLIVVGLGQCGGRIADEFARLGGRAKRHRGANVISDAFAIDTDAAALGGLKTIKSSHSRRIVIGEARSKGHGVGGLNEIGAQIAKEDGYKIIDVIRRTRRFTEASAFLVVAGAAGGTGSGAMPIIIRLLKERYKDKPVYAMIILPFEHEEEIEERTVYNTAICLKSAYAEADAVFLIDNQRYAARGYSLASNIAKTNMLIVDPFFSLLCAGEEKNRKRIGVSIIDAGDILQSLSGWTVIGYGKVDLPLITLPWDQMRDKGYQAMDLAISELSLQCNPKDALKALYLVSAPEKEMNMDLMKQLGERIRTLAPESTIRYGDYPVNKGLIDITLIFSTLREVEKVKNYYLRSVSIAETMQKKQEVITFIPSATEEAGRAVPKLTENP